MYVQNCTVLLVYDLVYYIFLDVLRLMSLCQKGGIEATKIMEVSRIETTWIGD